MLSFSSLASSSDKKILFLCLHTKDFPLSLFKGKTVAQLRSKLIDELVIYHFYLTGYLPANKKNKSKEILVGAIDEARKNINDRKSYYKDLSCIKIMKKVKELVGYPYSRQPERITLVKHLQDAEVRLHQLVVSLFSYNQLTLTDLYHFLRDNTKMNLMNGLYRKLLLKFSYRFYGS